MVLMAVVLVVVALSAEAATAAIAVKVVGGEPSLLSSLAGFRLLASHSRSRPWLEWMKR